MPGASSKAGMKFSINWSGATFLGQVGDKMSSKSVFNFVGLGAAILFGAVGVFQYFAPAVAQTDSNGPVILIVDQARLIGTSKAGKSIAEQMKSLQDTANKQLESEIGRIIKETEELKSKQGSMGDKAYLDQAKKLALQQNNIPVLRDIKVRELSLSEQKAIGEVSKVMRPILEEIVNARGATVLLDRSAVMYASTDTDITDEVLTKLDAKITSVKVEQVSLVKDQQK